MELDPKHAQAAVNNSVKTIETFLPYCSGSELVQLSAKFGELHSKAVQAMAVQAGFAASRASNAPSGDDPFAKMDMDICKAVLKQFGHADQASGKARANLKKLVADGTINMDDVKAFVAPKAPPANK